MLEAKAYKDLTISELDKLNEFLKVCENKLPYQLIGFVKFIDATFNYKNVSLIVCEDNQVKGFVPQWIKEKTIESVPWRDKGGPLYLNQLVLEKLVTTTQKMVGDYKLDGFIWKDFKTELLETSEYLINVDVDLSTLTESEVFEAINTKERNKIRKAQANELVFVNETDRRFELLDMFYDIFVANRKRLGVPVYPKNLFKNLFTYMKGNIEIFCVYSKELSPLAFMIALHNGSKVAIDGYSASTDDALRLKANDFMIYRVVKYYISKGFEKFDFGGDSPLQQGLIQFKLKWLGTGRKIKNSFFGNVVEVDHNLKKYGLAKSIIRKMPIWAYKIFSRIIVN